MSLTDEVVSSTSSGGQVTLRNQDIDKLAAGLLALYEPGLKKLQSQLSELTNKQTSVLQEIENENARFNRAQDKKLQEMVAMITEYGNRLQRVKEQMRHITGNVSKLEKRAMKLQQMKQKEALQREHNREAQLTREQELIAKPHTQN